jgi:hypothetical protein
MPTIYEHRCLSCGSHSHDKSECPKAQARNAKNDDFSPVKAPSKGNQNYEPVNEKSIYKYGKEELATEIKAEESLMNY